MRSNQPELAFLFFADQTFTMMQGRKKQLMENRTAYFLCVSGTTQIQGTFVYQPPSTPPNINPTQASPEWASMSESHSDMCDSLQHSGLYTQWNSPRQNTGVGSCSLLQGIFPTQGSNPGLPHILYQQSHQPGPKHLIPENTFLHCLSQPWTVSLKGTKWFCHLPSSHIW